MELKNKIILITGSAGTIGSLINKKIIRKIKIFGKDSYTNEIYEY